MAISWVNEKFINRPGTDSQDSPSENTRVFQVETDTASDNSAIILADPNIPLLGSEYPIGSGWIASHRTAAPESAADGYHWLVVVKYTLRTSEASVIESDWPWNRDPNISFSFDRVHSVLENAYSKDVAYSVDAAGVFDPIGAAININNPPEPVLNSALQPFDPPIMQDRTILRISIALALKHENFDPNERLMPYVNTINKDVNDITIAGIVIPQFTAYMQDIKATKAWTETTPERAYWNLNYSIIVDPQTHLYKIQDKGWYELSTASADSTNNWTPIMDTGVPPRKVTEAVLLNGNGAKKGVTEEMFVIPYHGYWETTWTDLIGNPLPAEW